MPRRIFILGLLAAFCGCALLKEPGQKLTVAQKTIAAELLSDWNARGKSIVMKDHNFGYDPASFKGSACHGTGLFEKYELDTLTEGSYTTGTLAYYCPPENRYWINQYSGGAVYINRWAGPFAYKAGDSGSPDAY